MQWQLEELNNVAVKVILHVDELNGVRPEVMLNLPNGEAPTLNACLNSSAPLQEKMDYVALATLATAGLTQSLSSWMETELRIIAVQPRIYLPFLMSSAMISQTWLSMNDDLMQIIQTRGRAKWSRNK
jgi:hypothetical protein